jgi:hypothetical protein
LKLLFCTTCGDIRSLGREVVSCACGLSSGVYASDGIHATVAGNAAVLGLHNRDLREAVSAEPTETMTVRCWRFRSNHPRLHFRSHRDKLT